MFFCTFLLTELHHFAFTVLTGVLRVTWDRPLPLRSSQVCRARLIKWKWWWKAKDRTEPGARQSFTLIHHAFQQPGDIPAAQKSFFFFFLLHIIPFSEISWVENSSVIQRGWVAEGLWSVRGSKRCGADGGNVSFLVGTKEISKREQMI